MTLISKPIHFIIYGGRQLISMQEDTYISDILIKGIHFLRGNPKRILIYPGIYCGISLKRLERIVLKSLHIIFIVYIMRSETFIEIAPLQHLKISRQTFHTSLSKICVTTFTVLTLSLNFSKMMHTIHTSMTSTF